jgi:type IV secretion system protein VirD4
LDPILFISGDDPYGLDDSKSLAESIMVREPGGDGKTEFFYAMGERKIAAHIGAVAAYGEPGTKSMQAVAEFMANEAKGKKLRELMKVSSHWGGMLARMGHELEQATGETLASINAVASKPMQFLNSTAIAESMSGCTFSPYEFKTSKRPLDVYIVLPQTYARAYKGWLRTVLDGLLRGIVRGGSDERKLVHFHLDEIATIMEGRMPCVQDALDKGRKYGIRLYGYWQNAGQLILPFPHDRGQTWVANTTGIWFSVNDLMTAQELSRRLGNETQLVWGQNSGTSGGTNSSSSQGGHSTSFTRGDNRGWSAGESWQQQTRELLKPEEILALPRDVAIICPPGLPPVWTKLVKFYEEPWLWKRRSGGFGGLKTLFKSLIVLCGACVLAWFTTFLLLQQERAYDGYGERTERTTVQPKGAGTTRERPNGANDGRGRWNGGRH